MKTLTAILTCLSLLLLGAHHLRFGEIGLTASYALLAAAIFLRRDWLRVSVLAALGWGAWTWADATVGFIRLREMFGADWGRLAVIMGVVIAFNLAAAILTISDSGRRWYHVPTRNQWVRACVFMLVFLGLAVVQSKAPFSLLLAERMAPGAGWFEITLLAFYGSWVAELMLDARRQPVVRRWIWSFFSIAFFAQLSFGLAGVEKMLMTGSLHLPVPALILGGPLYRGGGLFMLILFGITLLLVGPAWCSHLCYIGAWDDSCSRLGPKRSNAVSRKATLLGRIGTLAIVVLGAVGLRGAGVSWIIAAWGGAIFGLVGVGIMLFVSRRRGTMVHCTVYCPMGLLANLFGKVSPWRIRIGRDCTRCNACFSRCRYSALDDAALDAGRPALSCTLCGDCVGACKHGQIQYVFPGLTAERARAAFITLVVSLHAVFLGVARM